MCESKDERRSGTREERAAAGKPEQAQQGPAQGPGSGLGRKKDKELKDAQGLGPQAQGPGRKKRKEEEQRRQEEEQKAKGSSK